MADSKEQPLCLNPYETEQGYRWNWNKGLFASQEFDSEQAAIDALSNGRIEFSSLDDEDILGALHASAEVNDNLLAPFDYWLVDGACVFEPSISGRLLGRLPEFRIAAGMKTLKMSARDLQVLLYQRDGA